jgi:hypothetical protein
MSENSKAPTDASTRPLGNTAPQPTPLARGGIGPNARAKMRHINPDATRAVRETLARQLGHDGHARDRR